METEVNPKNMSVDQLILSLEAKRKIIQEQHEELKVIAMAARSINSRRIQLRWGLNLFRAVYAILKYFKVDVTFPAIGTKEKAIVNDLMRIIKDHHDSNIKLYNQKSEIAAKADEAVELVKEFRTRPEIIDGTYAKRFDAAIEVVETVRLLV